MGWRPRTTMAPKSIFCGFNSQMAFKSVSHSPKGTHLLFHLCSIYECLFLFSLTYWAKCRNCLYQFLWDCLYKFLFSRKFGLSMQWAWACRWLVHTVYEVYPRARQPRKTGWNSANHVCNRNMENIERITVTSHWKESELGLLTVFSWVVYAHLWTVGDHIRHASKICYAFSSKMKLEFGVPFLQVCVCRGWMWSRVPRPTTLKGGIGGLYT